jgi:energy-coupling factor transport system permease protein
MKVLQGFDYRRGTSLIHKMDPRAKLVYLILFSALAVYFLNPILLFALFLSSIPIVAIAGIGKRWSQSIRGSAFFIVMIFVINFIVYLFYGLPIAEAITLSVAMSLRFVVLISIFSSYFLTTSPEDLTQSMVQLRVPYDYALTFNMAMRFVPTLSKEAQIIMDAQKSRGLEMEKGNFMQKIKNYIPVLVPLIVSSFRRAELVADAMESRAFGATKKRTSLYVLQLGNIDYAFLCIVIASSEVLLLTSLLFGFR